MKDGLIKVAAGTPGIRVADCRYNAEQCFRLMREADRQGVRLLVLPELCLTGYTCGDLFLQDTLLEGAQEALRTVLEATKNLDMVTALGLPVRHGGRLYNCAAVICRGLLLGVVPKQGLSLRAPFEEGRWFAPGRAEAETISLAGQEAPFGGGLLFDCDTMPGLTLGVEVGGEACAAVPPSARLAQAGAGVLFNPAAAPELVGGAGRRRTLLAGQSARLACGYLSAGAGEGESSTDLVFSGHSLITENGALLAERRLAAGLLVSELDLGRLHYERRRTGAPGGDLEAQAGTRRIAFSLEPVTTALTRPISATPFVPEEAGARAERCDEVLKIAALGLKRRLEHTGAKTCVIGLSGGLDSTLAVLITMIAMNLLGRPAHEVIAVTMPCFGTTDRTRDNAVTLAERLGATLRRIDISDTVRSHFRDIGQPVELQDVTFENAQARERTQVLMDIANQTGGLVIGTGDLSELALGWATYNGDHMSMYGVNADIPKTLVRHLVRTVSADKAEEDAALFDVLADILDTPVSPELLPAVSGRIVQRTEDLVGPYELHDFFLYHMVRWGARPRKVLRLAEYAFASRYDRATILKWLEVFCRRFFAQQFKRSCLPDGPKVGSVGLSPRGDWRMPSDVSAALWLEELESLK